MLACQFSRRLWLAAFAGLVLVHQGQAVRFLEWYHGAPITTGCSGFSIPDDYAPLKMIVTGTGNVGPGGGSLLVIGFGPSCPVDGPIGDAAASSPRIADRACTQPGQRLHGDLLMSTDAGSSWACTGVRKDLARYHAAYVQVQTDSCQSTCVIGGQVPIDAVNATTVSPHPTTTTRSVTCTKVGWIWDWTDHTPLPFDFVRGTAVYHNGSIVLLGGVRSGESGSHDAYAIAIDGETCMPTGSWQPLSNASVDAGTVDASTSTFHQNRVDMWAASIPDRSFSVVSIPQLQSPVAPGLLVGGGVAVPADAAADVGSFSLSRYWASVRIRDAYHTILHADVGIPSNNASLAGGSLYSVEWKLATNSLPAPENLEHISLMIVPGSRAGNNLLDANTSSTAHFLYAAGQSLYVSADIRGPWVAAQSYLPDGRGTIGLPDKPVWTRSVVCLHDLSSRITRAPEATSFGFDLSTVVPEAYVYGYDPVRRLPWRGYVQSCPKCGADSYRTTNCVLSPYNGYCTPCTACRESFRINYWTATRCNGTHDAVCMRCSSCDGGAVISSCTPLNDTVCEVRRNQPGRSPRAYIGDDSVISIMVGTGAGVMVLLSMIQAVVSTCRYTKDSGAPQVLVPFGAANRTTGDGVAAAPSRASSYGAGTSSISFMFYICWRSFRRSMQRQVKYAFSIFTVCIYGCLDVSLGLAAFTFLFTSSPTASLLPADAQNTVLLLVSTAGCIGTLSMVCNVLSLISWAELPGGSGTDTSSKALDKQALPSRCRLTVAVAATLGISQLHHACLALALRSISKAGRSNKPWPAPFLSLLRQISSQCAGGCRRILRNHEVSNAVQLLSSVLTDGGHVSMALYLLLVAPSTPSLVVATSLIIAVAACSIGNLAFAAGSAMSQRRQLTMVIEPAAVGSVFGSGTDKFNRALPSDIAVDLHVMNDSQVILADGIKVSALRAGTMTTAAASAVSPAQHLLLESQDTGVVTTRLPGPAATSPAPVADLSRFPAFVGPRSERVIPNYSAFDGSVSADREVGPLALAPASTPQIASASNAITAPARSSSSMAIEHSSTASASSRDAFGAVVQDNPAAGAVHRASNAASGGWSDRLSAPARQPGPGTDSYNYLISPEDEDPIRRFRRVRAMMAARLVENATTSSTPLDAAVQRAAAAVVDLSTQASRRAGDDGGAGAVASDHHSDSSLHDEVEAPIASSRSDTGSSSNGGRSSSRIVDPRQTETHEVDGLPPSSTRASNALEAAGAGSPQLSSSGRSP